MKTFGIAVVCVLVLLAWQKAHALTIPSGHVISNGEVVAAHETESAKRNLAKKGSHIGGGILAIQVGDNVHVVPIKELIGKSESGMMEHIATTIAADISGVDIPTEEINSILKETEDTIISEVKEEVKEVIEKAGLSIEKIEEIRKEVNKLQGDKSIMPDDVADADHYLGHINNVLNKTVAEAMEDPYYRDKINRIVAAQKEVHGETELTRQVDALNK